jgi:hypothetical protein
MTVRVVGVGLTYEEAKKNGLRNAVMEAYGALVISERRIKNNALSEDELSYSIGMVEKFKVIDYYIGQRDRLFHLNMQVQVSSSKLKTRFVYSTDSKVVDGQSLGKKILEGRSQANSELERFNEARGLFQYQIKNLSEKLYDVTVDGIKTTREGFNFQTNVVVTVETNSEVIDTLCAVGKAYARSILPAAPATYRSYAGSIFFNRPYSCSVNVPLDSSLFNSVLENLNSGHICLSLLDKNKVNFSNFYYSNTQIIDRGIARTVPAYARKYGYSCDLGGGCSYVPRAAGVSTDRGGMGSEYPDTIRVSKLPWGNAIKFDLTLPPIPDSQVLRIAEIQAKITSAQNCK